MSSPLARRSQGDGQTRMPALPRALWAASLAAAGSASAADGAEGGVGAAGAAGEELFAPAAAHGDEHVSSWSTRRGTWPPRIAGPGAGGRGAAAATTGPTAQRR